MIRLNHLRPITSAICAGMLLFSAASCADDNIREEYEVTTPAPPAEKPAVEAVTFPTAFIGNLGDAEDLFKTCFTNIVAPADARIIIIESGAIADNEEVLAQAYGNGALIAVLNPDGATVSAWSERNDVFYAGPDANERCAIYGFNNNGTYYSLDESGLIGDEDVPLFHFSGWINSVLGSRLRGVDLRTKDIRKRFLPQSVTHTFKISLDERQLTESHWAGEGQLSLSSTASVTYTIYPIHVFDANAAAGDYYAVEAEMTLHNSPMDNGTWVRRRGNEVAEMCGFYLNRCNVSASLLRKANGELTESTTHRLADGAGAPSSVSDAVSYNPGFAWTMDATVSGGIADSKDNHRLLAYNNWTWDNSASQSMPGIAIRNNSSAANVDYTLTVNGLPGASADLAVTPVPDAATGDLTFHYSWIWHVSGINESTDDRFYMQVAVNPVYQAYQWIAGGKMTIGEFESAMPESRSTFKFPLTPPNRVATCSTIIRNTSTESYYISDIRFWRNKSTDQEPDYVMPQTISTASATGGSGISATMLLLPAGDYTVKGVRYSMVNNERVDECEIVNKTPISLPSAGNVTIDFGSSLFTVR